MRAGSRSITRFLVVVIVLTVMSAGAAARVLEILNGSRGFRAVWRSLEFTYSGGGATVRCAATLEGEFVVLAVEKVAGATMGTVQRASMGACTGGSATVLTSGLPWELNYDGFSGTLPTITSIRERLLGASFQVRNELVTCLVRSEASNLLYAIASTTREAGGLLELPSLRVEEAQSLPLTGGFPCELSTIRLAGTATTTVQGETAKLTVRLVEQPPTVTLTPAEVDIAVGATTAEQKYVIRNNAAAPNGASIRISSIGLADGTRFRVEDGGGTCTNRVLGPQATCQFEVNYVAAYEAQRVKRSLVVVYAGNATPTATSIAR